MILVSRTLLLIFAVFAFTAVLTMGILGYLFFHPDHGLGYLEAKLTGEWFLFAALCAVLLLSGLTAAILRAAPRINREIDRIIRTSSHHSLSAQLRSSRLGPIGDNLLRLYSRIAELNEKQNLKMSAQHNLITFLSGSIKAPLVITDISGRIQYVSEKIENEYQLSRSELIGTSVESFAPNVMIQSVLRDLGTKNSYERERKGDLPFSVIPVYNRLRQVDYLVFDFRADSPLAAASPPEARPAPGGSRQEGNNEPPRRSRFFSGIFGRTGGSPPPRR